MKVSLIISSLEAGGAQRVMCTMANYWNQKGWQVTLLSLSGETHDFYHLDSGVKRVGLDSSKPSGNPIQALYWNIKRMLMLREEINKSSPDVVISFMDKMNVMTLISTYGTGLPVLISERIDPREQDIGRVWSFFRQSVYPRATKLIVQSKPVLDWVSERWPQLPAVVIHNPVSVPDKITSSDVLDPAFNWCIGMGRLVRQKGFDLLIEAFSSLVAAGLDDNWRLIILGDGEERSALERQIEASGLTGRVWMPGKVKNPTDYFYQADLFVMPSRYEGFPNALLEALACGLPVISTNCQSGPAEIIEQNFNGILIETENVLALMQAMGDLIQHDTKRAHLAENAINSVSKFDVERIMEKWEQVIEEAA